jgi:hypothetical protein
VNGKGFERERSWSNLGYASGFSWKDRNDKNIVRLVGLSVDIATVHLHTGNWEGFSFEPVC